MNRIVLISISLLILIVGICCVSAVDLNGDASLASGLGDGGSQGNLFSLVTVHLSHPTLGGSLGNSNGGFGYRIGETTQRIGLYGGDSSSALQ